MLTELFYKLSLSEQDQLVQKFGLTRKGDRKVEEEELEKVRFLLVPRMEAKEIVPIITPPRER